MTIATHDAGCRPARAVQVFASDAVLAEVSAALGVSDFQVAAAGLPAVAAVVSDDVDGAIDLCRILSAERPVVLVSANASFDLRLAAARAGVHAILKRPVDPIDLLRCFEELDATVSGDGLSVVLVDDDRLVAEVNASILRSAGIDVSVVNTPRLAVEAIECLRPDLVLMDLRMPEVDGVELARVVRLSRELVTIPIMFLSAERDEARQAVARHVGGDDFIQKPVAPAKLIAQVKVRANRAKVLRAIGERDGLTGLLDHSRFRERLTHELSHCRRRGGFLSLAIIDVDRFKAVNDNHGHLVGDKVLRTLAQLLTAALRKSDVVGRCGGEEFGVILRDADAAEACEVIDKVRERFGATGFKVGSTDLTVTFSGGVASNDPCADSTDLMMAADRALYAAKAGGRNRVLRQGGAVAGH